MLSYILRTLGNLWKGEKDASAAGRRCIGEGKKEGSEPREDRMDHGERGREVSRTRPKVLTWGLVVLRWEPEGEAIEREFSRGQIQGLLNVEVGLTLKALGSHGTILSRGGT